MDTRFLFSKTGFNYIWFFPIRYNLHYFLKKIQTGSFPGEDMDRVTFGDNTVSVHVHADRPAMG